MSSPSYATNPLTPVIDPSDQPSNQAVEIAFSFLDPSEYNRLTSIFNQFNSPLPLTSVSQIAIAEDTSTNEIVAFFCFQLIPHAEPMWIHESYRGSKLWEKLVEMIYPLTERFPMPTFIHATTPETEAMCIKLGLTKVDYPVYMKP